MATPTSLRDQNAHCLVVDRIEISSATSPGTTKLSVMEAGHASQSRDTWPDPFQV